MAIDQYSVAVEHLKEAPAVTPQDVLNRAADLLEEFGWCQGHVAKKGGVPTTDVRNADSFCCMGAIIRAKSDLDAYNLELGWKKELVAGRWANFYEDQVPSWNDAPDRTKDAVVLALRAGLPQFRNN